MLTAHQRIALTRIGFEARPSDCGTPGAFYAIWPHPQEAWAYAWNGNFEPDGLEDRDPIVLDCVEFRVIPSNPPHERVWVCATDFDENLVHYVPELDDDGLAAKARLQAFCDSL